MTAAVACVALLAGACASDGAPTGDRADAIRTARVELGGAIAELGAAVVGTEEAVTRVRLGDPPAPDERREAVAAVRDGALAELEDALAATDGAEADSTDPAVEAAFASWWEARGAAADLLDAAAADLGHTELLAGIDATLAEIVQGWEVPGSYSQQVERFTDLRNRARGQVADLEGLEPRPSCSDGVANRREAAVWVADATEELRALVEARRGEEFDARREELTADVYGLDEVSGDPATVLARLDAGDRDCWRPHGATSSAADRFETAVSEVEQALNPDLD